MPFDRAYGSPTKEIKIMKSPIAYILASVLALGLIGCTKDDTVKIDLSQPEIVDVPAEGGSYDVKVSASDTWIIKDETRAWLNVAKYTSGADQYLKVEVGSNISEQGRTAEIELLSRNSKKSLSVKQRGRPAGQELKYRLPMVVHVLYTNASDTKQNIAQDRILATIKEVNELYAKSNINVEFYPASIDPSGNVMAEPGIDRVRWVSQTINPIDLMSEEDNEYLHLLWDPNKYVNVMLYQFSIPNILGIATFPLAPEQYPLDGLDLVKFSPLQVSDLKKLRGVSINSTWFDNQDGANAFGPYVSADLLARQTSIATTLAHELGHYLGLRHVFSEGPDGSCVDTDYCEDTPSYNKHRDYDSFVAEMMSDARYNPNFKNEFRWQSLFERETCSGQRFEAHNIMDYSYCYMDQFTPQQKLRMRHVLGYSPFIPGPKLSVLPGVRALPIAPADIPHSIVICRAHDSQRPPR